MSDYRLYWKRTPELVISLANRLYLVTNDPYANPVKHEIKAHPDAFKYHCVLPPIHLPDNKLINRLCELLDEQKKGTDGADLTVMTLSKCEVLRSLIEEAKGGKFDE